MDVGELWKRRFVFDLEQPVLCDTIRIENIRTYGAELIRVFEARAY